MRNQEILKKWTVMLYLAGDNNLDANGVIDLEEMKQVGSTGEINLIAQFDRAGAGLPTMRYLLKKGTSLQADTVEKLGEVNTGDPACLLDFIKWGVGGYPAEHYLLILWNHGQGWDDTDIFAGERVKGARLMRTNRIRHALFKTSVARAARLAAKSRKFSRAMLIDDDARDFLDSIELKQVLAGAKTFIGRKIDILGMDACLMSMAEVGYQVRDSVLFTVGSEETEPLDGWPYDSFLSHLMMNTDENPRELSKNIVNKYIGSYKSSGEAVTLSACDLTSAASFAATMKTFTGELINGLADSKVGSLIVNARYRAQEYQVKDNIDLISFCKLLKASVIPDSLLQACNNVIAGIKGKDGLVVASDFNGALMNESHGLAIYFPTRSVSPLYARLDFASATGWELFLKKFIAGVLS
jgi:hypothetical protein